MAVTPSGLLGVAAFFVVATRGRDRVQRRYTKKPMQRTTVFIPVRDKNLIATAAEHLGESQSQFTRAALLERATRVLTDTADGKRVAR